MAAARVIGKGSVWRLSLPLAGAFLTYLVAGSGLVYAEDGVPWIALGLIVGLVAGLVADGAIAGAIAGPLAVLAGVALRSSLAAPQGLALLLLLLVSGAAGAGASFARRWDLGGKAALALVVALVVGNMLLTAYIIAPVSVAFRGGASVVRELSLRPPPGVFGPDSDLYREIVWNMRDGLPYYSAAVKAWDEVVPGETPHSIFDIRQPAPFLLWAALPGWPMSAFWAFLALAAVAASAAPVVSSRAVPAALGVVSSAGIAAYLLGFGLSRQMLFMSDGWVGALVVVSFAAFALAQRASRHRLWMVVAALAALAAFACRELTAFLMVAGLVGAVAAPREHRRFDVLVWATSFLTGLTLWALHTSRVAHLISGSPQLAQSWLAGGGFGFLAAGVRGFTYLLSPLPWVPWLLAALGVIGALVQPDRQYRAFASVGVLLPLIAFLFVGNHTFTPPGTPPSNYWGAMIVPALFALAPSALSLLAPRRLAERLTSPVTAEVPEPALQDERTAI